MGRWVVAAAAVALAVGSPARAATITFDELAPGTGLTTAYLGLGVRIDSGCGPGLATAYDLGSSAQSGTIVARSWCPELVPRFELSFATTQSQVSLYARAGIGSGDFSLVAFDRSGLRVAETTATVTDAGWTKLSVGLSVPNFFLIARVVLASPSNCCLGSNPAVLVDTVTFDRAALPADTTPPTVTITSPLPNVPVPDDSTAQPLITARLNDDQGISGWCAAASFFPPPQQQCTLPVSGSLPTTVEADLRTYVDLSHGPELLHVWAYDFAGNRGEASVLVTPAPQPPNIYVSAIELTQAVSPPIQEQASGFSDVRLRWPGADYLPLAADKPTVVRAYIRETSYPAPTFDLPVTVLLSASRAGRSLAGSPLLATTVVRDAPLDYMQQQDSGTADFRLPAAWTAGGQVDLEVFVNPFQAVRECNICYPGGNRMFLDGVTFAPSATVPIEPVQLRWFGIGQNAGGVGGQLDPPDPSRLSLWDDAAALLPAARSSFAVDAWRGVVDVGDTSSCYSVMLDLLEFVAIDARFGIYVGYGPGGMFDGSTFTNAITGCGGMAYGLANFVDVTDFFGEPHELAHNFGLQHASCVHSEQPPCEAGWPFPHGTIGGYGYDLRGPSNGTSYWPFPLVHTHDFMSYGGGTQWISTLTWRRLFAGFRPKHTRVAVARLGDALVVQGFLTGDGAVLSRVLHVRADLTPRGVDTGLRLVVRNAGGNVLESAALRSSQAWDAPPGHVPFVAVVPAVAGVASVDVDRGGVMLSRLRRTRHSPVVAFRPLRRSARRSEPLVVRWRAADADGGRLRFAIYYRVADGPWQIVALGASGDATILPAFTLPRSPDLQLRIVASDGFNTTAVEGLRLRMT